jgi:type I restriction enzyme R subunit
LNLSVPPIQQHHNRLIDAAAVIQEIIAMHRAMQSDDERRAGTGLADDEPAFYDAVADEGGHAQPRVRELTHDVVHAIKHNLQVDGPEPYRDDVGVAIPSAVRRVLRKRDVRKEDLDPFIQ